MKSYSYFVSGFSDLLIEDQMALLKSSFMELNVLRLSYRYYQTRVKKWGNVWGTNVINIDLVVIFSPFNPVYSI